MTTPWRTFLRQNWTRILGAIGLVVFVSFAYAHNPRITEAVLASSLRQSIPLILGALCGLIGERSGIINIGIEGQMLMAAFISFLVNVKTGSLILATLAGMLTGALMGFALAFMSVTLRIDQIIGGTVLNMIAFGLTGYFYQVGLVTKGKFTPIPIPLLSEIPVIGPVFFQNPPLTYIALLLIFVVQFFLYHTRWGLRTRAVGEHPRAADTLGINVYWVRYMNVTMAGSLAGLAGAYLTLEAVGSFERMMTNGQGFVALAVMIFGKWNPITAWGAALLFGFAIALQTQLQFMGVRQIPHQFIGMLPYLLTIIVLAGVGGRTRPPAAVGQPYVKEG
ncbi:MAG: ABC transporter permease [Chloroflexi bacterium]|nr:ABC transporter permease [Chloroflexota bacterium]